MNKVLNFKRQMILGLVILLGSFISSSLFQQGWFCNVGGVVYGAPFLINPVYPDRINKTPRITVFVRIAGAVIVLISLVTRYDI